MAFLDFRCNSGFYFIYVKSYRVIISKCLMLFDCIHKIVLNISLLEKCPYSELFWSIFSYIRTEYEEILRISLYSVQMWKNMDHNNSEYRHFLRSFCVKYEIMRKIIFPEYDPSGNSIFFVPRWSRYFKFIVCI